jgi:hypothetical protein
MTLLLALVICLMVIQVALCVACIVVILRFERLLTNASNGAKDHFEKLRSVRQVGV